MVSKFSDITDKLIPKTAGGRLGFSRLAGLETLFQEYPLHGVKRLDFEDFCRTAELIQNKTHLTAEGLELIRVIKSGINRGRYNDKRL